MKASSLIAAALLSLSTLSHAADSCVWLSDQNSAVQVASPLNAISRTVAIANTRALAMKTHGCSVWLWDKDGIQQFNDEGAWLNRIDFLQLQQRYAGNANLKAVLAHFLGQGTDAILRYSAKNNSLWAGSGRGLILLDEQANVTQGLLLNSPIQDLVVDLDQGVWIVTQQELIHLDRSGKLLTRHDLNGRFSGVERIALDRLGNVLWLQGSQQAWQIAIASLAQSSPTTVPAVWEDGGTYQTGQKVSHVGYIYQALSNHTAHQGAGWSPDKTPSLWQRLAPTSPALDQEAWLYGLTYQAGQFVNYQGKRYQAISVHTAYLNSNWTPDATPSLWKLIGDAKLTPDSNTIKTVSFTGLPQDVAINGKTGELWVLFKDRMQVYGWDTQQRLDVGLAQWGIQQAQGLRFDAASQSFWLLSQQLATRFDVQGNVLAQVAIPAGVARMGARPFDVTPSLQFDAPSGLINSAQPTIKLTAGALCNLQNCGFEADYFKKYRLSVTLDGQALTGGVLDTATQQFSFPVASPLSNGPHRITAQVLDGFLNPSNVIDHTFTIDTVAPKFLEVLPASGSSSSTGKMTLTGRVDDADAFVTLQEGSQYGVTENNPAKGQFSWPLTLKPGKNAIELSALDMAGNQTTYRLEYSYTQTLPSAPVISKINLSKVNGGKVNITGAAAAVGAGLQVSITNLRSNVEQLVSASATGSFSASIEAKAGDRLSVFVQDASGNKSTSVSLTVSGNVIEEPQTPIDSQLPADPLPQASKIATSGPTQLSSSTAFLYSGANPIQTGVAPDTIEAKRASVLRGRVTDREGKALAGVTLTILNHPEYGQTVSRPNGLFDMVVNGGSALTINYSKEGYLSAQRTLDTAWQGWAAAPAVALTKLDSQVTTVTTNSPNAQIAQGNAVSDADGQRQATLVFPSGVTATMQLPDGASQDLATMNVRATEYTVGINGQNAMPGVLPPSSGYTYAVELSLDEAMAAGASRVDFNKPIFSYVENFLNFPVGGIVPAGYYDRAKAAWIPSENGRVISILAIENNAAVVDIDGSGIPATNDKLDALGFSSEELIVLAKTYQAGVSLWRVPIRHFTPWDFNWPYSIPKDATPPTVVPEQKENEDCPAKSSGSIIECENQSLGESIAISGTPFRLGYKSSRMEADSSRKISIQLTGPVVSSNLKHIHLKIMVAGQQIIKKFPAEPNKTYEFIWDGNDAYGRPVQGAQKLTYDIGYVYGFVEYTNPADFYNSFGLFGTGTLPISKKENNNIMWRSYSRTIGGISASTVGFGGWFIDVQHMYDPSSKTLLMGDGSNRSGQSIGAIVSVIAGGGTKRGDSVKATEAQILSPKGVAFDSSGNMYFAEYGMYGVRKVNTEGVITTVFNSGLMVNDIVFDKQGSMLYSVDNQRTIRKLTPDGVDTVYAGTGWGAFTGDGVLAINAGIGYPQMMAINTDDELYFAGYYTCRVRKIQPGGLISTVTSNDCFSGDRTADPIAVDVDKLGNLYVVEYEAHRIKKVTPDGIVSIIAGTGVGGFSGDGGAATDATLRWPSDVLADNDGNIYIADTGNGRIRVIRPNGLIYTVVGGGTGDLKAGETPANQVKLSSPKALAKDNSGNLIISESGNNRILKVQMALPNGSLGDFAIVSEDGTAQYQFDPYGRHVLTRSTLNNAELFAFSYDQNGFVSHIKDINGDVTTIERGADGRPMAIISQDGQRTVLTLGADGYLASVSNPAAETYRMTYSNDGLLKTFTNPRKKTSTMNYENGRLVEDRNAAGGGWILSATDLGGKNHEVSMTSAEGRTTRYRTEFSAKNERTKTITYPDGSSSTAIMNPGSAVQNVAADGTTTSSTFGPDPRFGMQAPTLVESTIRLPSGLEMKQSNTRAVVLENPSDVFSLKQETTTTTINGKTSTSVYDATQKRVTTTSPANRKTVMQLDDKGRPLLVQQPGILPLSYQYDARGRLEKITQGSAAQALTVAYTYNAEGELETVTDPAGKVTRYSYDLAGRVKTVTSPDGRVVSFDYDANGNVIGVQPPSRPVHGFAFDDVDQASAYQPPALPEVTQVNTRYEYNLDQQPVRITRPDGKLIEYGYDSGGRLAGLSSPDGNIVYGYLPTSGQLGSVTAGDVVQTFSYDGALPKTVQWSGPVAGTLSVSYDNFFRVQDLVLNGQSISYGYDNDGLLKQAGAMTLNRDAASGMLQGTTLGSVTTSQTYDVYGNLASLAAKYGSTALFSETFKRDKLGRIEEKTTTTGGLKTVWRYGYDAAGRLSDVYQNGTAVQHYEYDANGNRTLANGTTASYDAQDRLQTFGANTYSYSANGELQTATGPTGTSRYSYDVYGNLKQVQLASGGQLDYLVDGQGRRIGKKVNGLLVQGFIYQDQLKPIAELDGNGQIISRFVYGGKANVPEYLVKGSESFRLITDALGSVRQVVSTQTGKIAQEIDYDAWGNALSDSNPGFQPFGFAGGLYDKNTGLVRFGVRDYDAKTGRWTAKDPIGFGGGDSNVYAYVGGNPVSYVDPFGLAPGDKYSTADAAGKQAIRDINPQSIRDGREYAGRVYKNPDGSYSYTPPNKGTKDRSNAGFCPKGTENAGDYHTHGANDPGYDNENFSPADKAGNDKEGVPGYLGTPSGDIKKYTPRPGSPLGGTVKKLGTGAK